MTHTPGPWEVHDGGRFGQYGDLGPSICAMTGPDTCQPLFDIVGPADVGECKANAQLVAAAPELLAACRNIELVYAEYMSLFPPIGRAMDMVMDAVRDARAAIRKADGVS